MGGYVIYDFTLSEAEVLRFTIYDLRFTIYEVRFTIYDLRFGTWDFGFGIYKLHTIFYFSIFY